jgi:hypothetical protein
MGALVYGSLPGRAQQDSRAFPRQKSGAFKTVELYRQIRRAFKTVELYRLKSGALETVFGRA